ncbi:F-box protein SKIP23-like [Phragmites australis]|uniref:F-box protein SKIP23-like n=1 Tax=Phragmites australis TaxID=29695 RepID=UPI002D7886F0|nr:F-box protein SKIP23-like [Phragmites australis]
MGSASVELPEDVLMLILAALEVPDLVRAGSVCSSWHGAYTSLRDLGLCKQQQTPCLLYTAKSAGAGAAGLYSLAEKKPYTLALPDPPIRSRYLIGSAYGWIITVDDRSELHLVNPITGDQIALPSITTIEHVTPTYDDNGAVKEYYSWAAMQDESEDPPSVFGLSKLRDYFFTKAFLSSDPSTGSYIVVVIHNPRWQISFARGGDDCWTWLPPYEFFADCVFKDGLLYALTNFGGIHAFDFSGPAVKQKVILETVKDYIFENMYIAEAPCGDLLQIWGDYHSIDQVKDVSQPELNPLEEDDDFSEPEFDCGTFLHCSTLFKVYRVDLTAKNLVEISSLGENVLFLGQNQSFCLRAEEHPQLKANHVYFTDNDEYMPFGRKNISRDIGVLDLGNNTREKIVSPQIWSNWPSPVWMTPNPRKMDSASGRSTGGTAGAQAPPAGCRRLVFRHGWSVAFLFLLFSLFVSWFI